MSHDRRGAIDWLEFLSMHLVRRVLAGKTGRGYFLKTTRAGCSNFP